MCFDEVSFRAGLFVAWNRPETQRINSTLLLLFTLFITQAPDTGSDVFIHVH